MKRAMITQQGWLRDFGMTPLRGRMLAGAGLFWGGEFLEGCGLTEGHWIDSSHLMALRSEPA
ncbi:hypothetical protein MK489_02940 [Myxococcota bacterium]|nr:hypothetical protein [Myxococcota bacterium]